MLKHFLKSLMAAVAFWLFNRYRRLSVDVLKIEAATYYLKGVRAGREGVLSILKIWLGVFFFALGIVLLHAGLFTGLYLWTQSLKAVVIGLLALGGLYVVVILLAVRCLLSEKAWMGYFKADKLVNSLIEKK